MLYGFLDFGFLDRFGEWLELFMGGFLTIPYFIYAKESLLSHEKRDHPIFDQSTVQRYSLTPRETEVTRHLLEGLTYNNTSDIFYPHIGQ